jgi:mRNA interferase RelE/StbE
MSNTEPSAPPVWTLQVDPDAQKQLDRLPPRDFARVDAALEAMRVDPLAGNIKRLKNHPHALRRRVGNYRVFFDLDHAAHVVIIASVERRTSTMYRKRRR